MTFEEYQKAAMKTAKYRETSPMWLPRAMYCALGLASEAGEAAGEAKRVIRDDGEHFTGVRADKIATELGDCLWYIATLAEEFNLKLEDIAVGNIAKLASRMERGVIQGEGGER